jgi:hypothetical protein
MTLNENTIQVKLYKWFYGAEKLPMSLCPYFWKLALMWITILPLSIISLPAIILNKPLDLDGTHMGIKSGTSILFYVTLFLLFSMGLVVVSAFGVTLISESFQSIRIFGCVLWFFGFVGGLVFGIKKLVEYIQDHKTRIYDEEERDEFGNYKLTGRRYYFDNGKVVFIEPKTNIFKEMYKAIKNKYCPRITWINK